APWQKCDDNDVSRQKTLVSAFLLVAAIVASWLVFRARQIAPAESHDCAREGGASPAAPAELLPTPSVRGPKTASGSVGSADTPSPSRNGEGISIRGTVHGPDGEVV